MHTTWPPPEHALIYRAMREWDAWYAGDTARLAGLYGAGQAVRDPGVVGRIRRWFWGETPASTASPQSKVHVPIAATICQESASLLFGEPPTVTIDDGAAQARLDLILGTGTAHQELQAAAETQAALGGTYLRVVWDQAIAEHPFIARVDADHAIPRFAWGRLVGVTFWRVLGTSIGTTYRHLEDHAVGPDGIGYVEHSLWAGSDGHLGARVPLADRPETLGLADAVDAESRVSTMTPGLDVVYVPNRLPNRSWREHPVGAHLGRSDLDGIEGLMDRYDEAWSSWMRELRIGKARIVAAQSALDDQGPGRGAAIDLDREVYEAVNTPPGAADRGGDLPIRAVQFQMRVQEHEQTCTALLEQILQSAGYSPQSFGLDGGGAAMTATEVQAKERASMATRGDKLRAWEGALEALAVKALAVDAAIFPAGVRTDAPVTVTFPPAARESALTLAQTVQALRAAQAVSIETAVRIAHPDWSETEVTDEAGRIAAEQGTPAPDPDVLGVPDLEPVLTEE